MQDKKSFPISFFLIDAGINWITENNDTALVIIDPNFPDVVLPSSVMDQARKQEEGALMFLDISPNIVDNYQFNKEGMSFDTILDGQRTHVILPVYSIKMLKGKSDDVTIDVPSISAEEYLRYKHFYCPSFVESQPIREIMGGKQYNSYQQSKNTRSRSHLTLVK